MGMNKNCKVYYEDWQLQCCGDPFSVGDDIEWTAIAKHYKLPKHDVDIDFMEEHHLEWNCKIKGRVNKIYAELSKRSTLACQSYEKTNTQLIPVNYADGYTYPHGLTLWGYVVELSNVVTESASDDLGCHQSY